mgnify:FL=1|tara:strand:+ start:1230 stop:1781 length:552 start_codon:yes stop_codon:yes gene_type:complete
MIGIPALDEIGIDEETWSQVAYMAEQRQVSDDELLKVQQTAAKNGRWDVVYALSVLAGLETSVLIDAEDVISIDWGTSGHVQLSPPVGCKAPFKLWVHTHPGFAAYWSGTDTRSLSFGIGIIEQAMVLGSPGVKTSRNATILSLDKDVNRISSSGPLQQWSDEDVLSWDDWYVKEIGVGELNV